MTDLFFCFESLDREIEKKIESDRTETALLMDELRRKLAGCGLGNDDLNRLDQLFADLSAHRFDDYEPSYLNHPIRVTAAWADHLERMSLDEAVFGLCHNIRESGAGGLAAIEESQLIPTMRARLDDLTIDRSRERDPAYLARYYDRIAAANGSLIVFKALDKLDNKLLYPLYDIDSHHFAVVTDYVCPRVKPLRPRLAEYLERLTAYVGSTAAKRRHRRGEPARRLG